jgi:hypothetical protein
MARVKGIAAAALLGTALLVAAPAAQAIVIDLVGDHCSLDCGTGVFGTVDLTQNGSGVDVTVHLNDLSKFVKTGSGDLMAFKFNAFGVVAGDITILSQAIHSSGLPDLLAVWTGPVAGDGTGSFNWGIYCPTCGNGGGPTDAIVNDIQFSVANALVNDLIVPNTLGIAFTADILSGQTGQTGPVYAGQPGGPPIPPDSVVSAPSSLILLGLSLAGIGFTRFVRRKKE